MSQGHGCYECTIKTDYTYFECAYCNEKSMTHCYELRKRKPRGSYYGSGFTSAHVVVFLMCSTIWCEN